jgi:hypothetical protein
MFLTMLILVLIFKSVTSLSYCSTPTPTHFMAFDLTSPMSNLLPSHNLDTDPDAGPANLSLAPNQLRPYHHPSSLYLKPELEGP